MANEQNLKSLADRTTEEKREIGIKGGKASGKARREKKNLRLALEALLEKDFKDKNGLTVSGAEVLTAKLFEQAAKGNVKAFETLRDSVGQKPVEKVMVADVDQSIIADVESSVLDDTEN